VEGIVVFLSLFGREPGCLPRLLSVTFRVLHRTETRRAATAPALEDSWRAVTCSG